MSYEEVKHILRPNKDDIHMGVMRVDESKCNKCGLCILNCPFRVWKKGPDGIPVHKEGYACFSCFNCKVACPNDAISIVETYNVTNGFWKTEDQPLPSELPLEAKDEDGNPTEWNDMEKAIFNRRSVRNYKDKPVPETLIKRILEAGRFAPSAGNCQPWKFIVITDKALIKELDDLSFVSCRFTDTCYKHEKKVKQLAPILNGPQGIIGSFDPRPMMGAIDTIVRHREEGSFISLDAPVIIIILGDKRAVSTPQLNIGICGQNMNLVAISLGLGICWNNIFAEMINKFPPLKKKLGIEEPWAIQTTLSIGYPKFKQTGIVPREKRPVTWFREGANSPQKE